MSDSSADSLPSLADRLRILEPTIATADLAGIGGRLRDRPEDFEVVEIPAYAADGGEGGHVLFTLRKRGLTTEAAVREVVRATGGDPRSFGIAGLKDRDAVTTQWVSAPAELVPALSRFRHHAIELGEPKLHSHKLRRGHLRGNRFRIVVREPSVPIPVALERMRAKAERIVAHGLENLFGPQRFGHDGGNLDRGVALLRGHGRIRKGDIVASAGQSALFNLYVALRRERDLLQRVLAGDVLEKTTTGGMFVCDDPDHDQARLGRGELVITGPMFGAKMRAPTTDSPAWLLEREVLHRAGVAAAALQALGRRLPGTRRRLSITLEQLAFAAVADERGCGVEVSFALPAGSYATQLCREIQLP